MPELQGDDWAHQALSIAKVVSYAADFPSAEAWWSASAAPKSLGYRLTARMTTGSDDRARGPAPLRRRHRNLGTRGPSFELEYRIRHGRTGRQIWVLDRGLGKFDGSGRLIGLSGVLIDMSGRMSAERRVSEEAAARLAAIVESSEDAIISKSLAAPSPAGTRARNGCWATPQTKWWANPSGNSFPTRARTRSCGFSTPSAWAKPSSHLSQ